MEFSHQLINGRVLPKEEALIPLTDLGMLRAYAIFDFFRILDGAPVFIEDHLNRLIASADKMALDLPWSRADIHNMIIALIRENHADRAGCRIVVTGGFSEDGYTPSTPNIYMMLHNLPAYDPTDWLKGCKLISSPYVRDVPSVKTINYVKSILVNKSVKSAGAVEVLYHWKGIITECSRSNIFFVSPERSLITPAEGILSGITRKQVLDISDKLGIHIELRDIHMEELPWVSEAFITSSTRGVLPIIQIDDVIIGNGNPGELTMSLAKPDSQGSSGA